MRPAVRSSGRSAWWTTSGRRRRHLDPGSGSHDGRCHGSDHGALERGLVVLGILEADREREQGAGMMALCEAEDERAVQAAGEIGAHRYIGPEQLRSRTASSSRSRTAPAACSIVPEYDSAGTDGYEASQNRRTAVPDGDTTRTVPGSTSWIPAKTVCGATVAQGETLPQAQRGRALAASMAPRDERTHLACEPEAALMLGPVERPDPEVVPCQDQRSPGAVPQGDGELAVEPREGIDAPLTISLDDDLGVAARAGRAGRMPEARHGVRCS